VKPGCVSALWLAPVQRRETRGQAGVGVVVIRVFCFGQDHTPYANACHTRQLVSSLCRLSVIPKLSSWVAKQCVGLLVN
jgi:hypothetical protein